MKLTLLTTLCIWMAASSVAQKSGQLVPTKTKHPKDQVQYVYTPPQGTAMPQKLRAAIIYYAEPKGHVSEIVPLVKEGSKYKFNFEHPDSAHLLIVSLVDDYKNIIDNNNGRGYVFPLNSPAADLKSIVKAKQALLSLAGRYVQKLDIPAPVIIRQFEEGFAGDSTLKNSTFYYEYLITLHGVNKDSAINLLRNYAALLTEGEQQEASYSKAANIYQLLEMKEEHKGVLEKAKQQFPKGAIAKSEFWEQMYSQKSTEQSVLAAMQEYKALFADSSAWTKDNFYLYIVSILATIGDKQEIRKYEDSIQNKLALASSFNAIAWDATGGDLKGTSKDLEIARYVSKRSIDFIEEAMTDSIYDKDPDALIQEHVGFSDTYALVLYQLKIYDSAFYYQNEILKRGPMGVEGMERYAVYAEKAEGAEFARKFLEPEVIKGANSPAMLNQLERIYGELKLPEYKFANIKKQSLAAAKVKLAEIVIRRYGTQKAPSFNLKDLRGNMVSLASLKGKIVVLDFWATWCGPCRASFPHMQELVSKYKDDKDVVFLFVNTAEGGKPDDVLKRVSKFIEDNKYTFEVVLDIDRDALNAYKVEGIPAKFVINKKGDIISMDGGSSDINGIIESAKRTE